MENVTLKTDKTLTRFVQILILGSGFIIMLSVVFFSLFRIFEQITYDSISDLNREFAIQIDSLTESINSSINNYGMQLFYSDSVKTMMRPGALSNTERVYLTRDLNTSLSSTDFAESIFVLNGYSGHIYSTDPSHPDQTVDTFNRAPLKSLFLKRDNGLRFKPVHCIEKDSGKEYYAFMFYETYPDDTPKPGTLIVAVKSSWYKKALLAATPSSDLIVIDAVGSVLVSSDDELLTKYGNYYPLISSGNGSGYLTSSDKKEICMFYKSPSTGHTYMKISSIKKILPRLLDFRRFVVCLLLVLIAVFGIILLTLLIFAFLPMLRMKEALLIINTLQTGAVTDGVHVPSISSKKQIEAVVSLSERANLEQIFYDMLASKTSLLPERLFKSLHGQYGLLLIHALHRKDIYAIAQAGHPEFLVTKSSHIYACIGLFDTEKEYERFCQNVSSSLQCRCYLGKLFADFSTLTEHYANLCELRRLGLLISEKTILVHEEDLEGRVRVNTISSKDFTDLIVRMKSGSLEATRAKWQELLETISHYRYDEFQYILSRTEDTICKVLSEISSNLLKENGKLLPESPDQINSIQEVNALFDRAFVVICENFSEKKAEKYSELAEQIKRLVQESYHDTALNSQTIADRIHMNNAYLGRIFKNSYGRSINDYINTCRIEEALVLLRESDDPVEDIALKVGFANIKYFYVLFKKHIGTTPAKYRAQP